MKFIIQFAICFLVGVGVGWYIGHTGRNAEAHRIVHQGLANVEEVYDAAEARSALFAIPIIESADKKQAVAWFARPIARYYRKFSTEALTNSQGQICTNSQRQMIRTMIEQLASTNTIVADAIHAKIR